MKPLFNVFFRAMSAVLLTCHCVLFASCGGRHSASDGTAVSRQPVGPAFNADSAYSFCDRQCSFGPRTMNSEAHEQCGRWIAEKFGSMGLAVEQQRGDLVGYDGTVLRSTNIIARYKPELQTRVMVCAHWDSRPWADNDPDEANWQKPVMAANDGASGVAVMLEVARVMGDSLSLGVDFVCFDAEDWGVPEWSDAPGDSKSWALGAQHWSQAACNEGYQPRFAILLDMVGGEGAHFYREQYSLRYAQSVVNKVWRAAQTVGYGSLFLSQDGGMITDDHVPVNETAGIPCIDIVPFYPDCEASSFGPTWHTVADNMSHIDRATLKAVGQTIVQVLFSENAEVLFSGNAD